MARLIKKFLNTNSVDETKIQLSNNTYIKSRNAANDADVNLIKLNASDAIEFNSLPVYDGSSLATQGYVGTQLGDYIPTTQKAAANGVASLGADGKIPNNQVPAIAITDTFVVASEVAMLALSAAEKGDVAVRTDLNKCFILAGDDYATLADWQELLTPTDTVTSVNGETGVVVLDTGDISEGTNLYFTDLRAKTAAVSDAAYGAGWDNVVDVAPSKNAVYDKIETLAGGLATWEKENKTLIAGDVTNQYVDLANVARTDSIDLYVRGGGIMEEGTDYTVSYTGGAGGNTRITFAGILANAGDAAIEIGDVLVIKYQF